MFNSLFYLGSLIAQTKPTGDQVESGFVYVIAAFTVIWLAIAGYLFWLNRRQENLRREVELLRQEEAERRRALPDQPPTHEDESELGVGRSERR